MSDIEKYDLMVYGVYAGQIVPGVPVGHYLKSRSIPMSYRSGEGQDWQDVVVVTIHQKDDLVGKYDVELTGGSKISGLRVGDDLKFGTVEGNRKAGNF
jgi:hypothetical protein